jgi:hypothetical protein
MTEEPMMFMDLNPVFWLYGVHHYNCAVVSKASAVEEQLAMHRDEDREVLMALKDVVVAALNKVKDPRVLEINDKKIKFDNDMVILAALYR